MLEALRAGRHVTEILVAAGARAAGPLAEITETAGSLGIPVREVPRSDLESRSRSRNAQGVIALARAFSYASLEDIVGRIPGSQAALLVALDGVSDPQNLGALARSAEAAGVHGMVIPQRRAAGVTPAAEKAAAGAFAHLAVAQVPNLVRALEALRESGVWLVGLDGNAPSTIYELDVATEPVCLVVGGEGDGLSRLVRERCDVLAAIPMAGSVASLNASAAGAVALFEIRRRRDGR